MWKLWASLSVTLTNRVLPQFPRQAPNWRPKVDGPSQGGCWWPRILPSPSPSKWNVFPNKCTYCCDHSDSSMYVTFRCRMKKRGWTPYKAYVRRSQHSTPRFHTAAATLLARLPGELTEMLPSTFLLGNHATLPLHPAFSPVGQSVLLPSEWSVGSNREKWGLFCGHEGAL